MKMSKKEKREITRRNDPLSLSKFGKERVGMLRRMKAATKRAFHPEVTVDDSNLWILFRVRKHMAMAITKNVADMIEVEYTRDDGETFLNAFSVICRACTPEYIDKIFRMMFKKPVYFRRNLGNDTIRWLALLPTPLDHTFRVSISPIKVEYLGEFCLKERLLTHDGPYISAKFTTTQDMRDAAMSTTEGLFEIYNAADSVFGKEWPLPGVIKYSISATVVYALNTEIGSDMDTVMEIIRRCVSDLILRKDPLWKGYFGEDHPQTNKRCRPYYEVSIEYRYPEFIHSMDAMTKTKKYAKSASVVEYSTSFGQDFRDGVLPADESNFNISENGGLDSADNSLTVTIYPPLENRSKTLD